MKMTSLPASPARTSIASMSRWCRPYSRDRTPSKWVSIAAFDPSQGSTTEGEVYSRSYARQTAPITCTPPKHERPCELLCLEPLVAQELAEDSQRTHSSSTHASTELLHWSLPLSAFHAACCIPVGIRTILRWFQFAMIRTIAFISICKRRETREKKMKHTKRSS